MFTSSTGSSLVSSSQLVTATWEHALSHFRRALLECGSSLGIEHSQRLGLLFSKRVGDTEELKKWASLFDAEEVSTTALILQALVSHNQWKAAIQLLQLNKEAPATKELCEVLAQNLTRIGRWQETLALTQILASPDKSENIKKSTELTASRSSLQTNMKCDDSHQMATNPAFLPEEERKSFCGFVAAVAQGFPRKQEWEKAVEVLRELEALTDSATQLKLFEYRIARLVHEGQKYTEVVELSRTDSRFQTSPSLLRSLLHCALALENRTLSLHTLALLMEFGTSAVSIKMFESACTLFISSGDELTREDLLRFESLVCVFASCIRTPSIQKVVAAFCADYDLRIPIFVAANRNVSLAYGKEALQAGATSITQLDRVATALVKQNRWKEALQIVSQIDRQTAENDNEEVILLMLRTNCSTWEQTLQFFQT